MIGAGLLEFMHMTCVFEVLMLKIQCSFLFLNSWSHLLYNQVSKIVPVVRSQLGILLLGGQHFNIPCTVPEGGDRLLNPIEVPSYDRVREEHIAEQMINAVARPLKCGCDIP